MKERPAKGGLPSSRIWSDSVNQTKMSKNSDSPRIIRTRKDKDHPYFLANRTPYNDERLSWEARGVMAYLMSKPDHWEVKAWDLEQKGPAGKSKIYRILQEMENAGYLERKRKHKPDGTFTWESIVYETPRTPTNTETSPSPDLPDMVKPYMDEPDMANRESLVSSDVVSNDLVSNNSLSLSFGTGTTGSGATDGENSNERGSNLPLSSGTGTTGSGTTDGEKISIRGEESMWDSVAKSIGTTTFNFSAKERGIIDQWTEAGTTPQEILSLIDSLHQEGNNPGSLAYIKRVIDSRAAAESQRRTASRNGAQRDYDRANGFIEEQRRRWKERDDAGEE